MANNCMENEGDAAKVIHRFEEIIQNKKSDIVWLAYCQGKIFQKFRSKERIVNEAVTKLKVSKSTIVFKIVLRKLIDKYRKTKTLHYFKKHLKLIKEVCKETASEFK